MKAQKNCKNRCKGFSLLELLLSIAIISLIILMATRYFSTVRSGQQQAAAVQEIQGIRSAVSAIVGANPSVTINVLTLCQNKNIPTSFCSCSGTACTAANLIFPWDSSTGSATSTVSVSGSTMTIAVASFPDTSACNNVANALGRDVTASCTATPPTFNFTL
jgi:prepilin-type N-terminal cleavage/methylation domain-containing protein